MTTTTVDRPSDVSTGQVDGYTELSERDLATLSRRQLPTQFSNSMHREAALTCCSQRETLCTQGCPNFQMVDGAQPLNCLKANRVFGTNEVAELWHRYRRRSI